MNSYPSVPDTSRYHNPDDDPLGPYLLTDATAPHVRRSLQYEWHGKLPPDGRSWRYSKERALALDAEGRTVLTNTGVVRLKRYLSEARLSPDEGKPEPVLIPTVQVILRAAMKELARAVARHPSSLLNIEWRDLERLLREVFESLGFSTELTPPGRDGGFDLRLQCSEDGERKTFIVEVKHWAGSGKRPGRKVLDALFEVVVKQAERATGLLLSTTGFTNALARGRTEVERQSIKLGGKEKIVSLCQSYVMAGSGVWMPTTSLADMLLDGTD